MHLPVPIFKVWRDRRALEVPGQLAPAALP